MPGAYLQSLIAEKGILILSLAVCSSRQPPLWGRWLAYDQEALSLVCKLCSVHAGLDLTPVKVLGDLLEVLFHPALSPSYSNSRVKYSVVTCLSLGFSCGIAEPPS